MFASHCCALLAYGDVCWQITLRCEDEWWQSALSALTRVTNARAGIHTPLDAGSSPGGLNLMMFRTSSVVALLMLPLHTLCFCVGSPPAVTAASTPKAVRKRKKDATTPLNKRARKNQVTISPPQGLRGCLTSGYFVCSADVSVCAQLLVVPPQLKLVRMRSSGVESRRNLFPNRCLR